MGQWGCQYNGASLLMIGRRERLCLVAANARGGVVLWSMYVTYHASIYCNYIVCTGNVSVAFRAGREKQSQQQQRQSTRFYVGSCRG